jgi:hypothetical protein
MVAAPGERVSWLYPLDRLPQRRLAKNAIKIEHHKTGAIVWHPLEEMTDNGPVKFYEEAERILAHYHALAFL